ncbi:hypothetical protein DFH29DRAFT_940772 [Suillus ampliporus]|nr:hypothetical protein DFH29DRAFT_940772 [Suillus ampliporus]
MCAFLCFFTGLIFSGPRYISAQSQIGWPNPSYVSLRCCQCPTLVHRRRHSPLATSQSWRSWSHPPSCRPTNRSPVLGLHARRKAFPEPMYLRA